ncbi:MAG: response regulator [Thermoanaerobaculia bacterium]
MIPTSSSQSSGRPARSLIGASSADEALGIAKESPPDLVLTDIAIPGSNGFHLLRALREEARVTAPVVALTAHGSPEDEARALGTGFALYLRKPVVPGELAAMLAGVLSGNSRAPSGAP